MNGMPPCNCGCMARLHDKRNCSDTSVLEQTRCSMARFCAHVTTHGLQRTLERLTRLQGPIEQHACACFQPRGPRGPECMRCCFVHVSHDENISRHHPFVSGHDLQSTQDLCQGANTALVGSYSGQLATNSLFVAHSSSQASMYRAQYSTSYASLPLDACVHKHGPVNL